MSSTPNNYNGEIPLMAVREVGSVCCGSSNVVPFESRDRIIHIPQIKGVVPSGAIGYAVIGDSLVDLDSPQTSYYDGEVLICNRNITKEQIKPHTICMCYIRSLGVLRPRKVKYEQGSIILSAINPAYKDEIYSENDIEIIAIVIGGFKHAKT